MLQSAFLRTRRASFCRCPIVVQRPVCIPGCPVPPVYRRPLPLISKLWRLILTTVVVPSELSKMQMVSCHSLTPSIPLSAGEKVHVLQPHIRVLWELVITLYLPLHSPILKLACWSLPLGSLSQHPLCLSHFSEVENPPRTSRFNFWAGSPSLISILCLPGTLHPVSSLL